AEQQIDEGAQAASRGGLGQAGHSSGERGAQNQSCKSAASYHESVSIRSLHSARLMPSISVNGPFPQRPKKGFREDGMISRRAFRASTATGAAVAASLPAHDRPIRTTTYASSYRSRPAGRPTCSAACSRTYRVGTLPFRYLGDVTKIACKRIWQLGSRARIVP